ncbi:MAG: hypothetical protein CL431_04620 [Acidimicrobiaceae bacterium]|jgi:hypothetical protein|nr:hypothetical protein [Acidimicrobiaceae bacterium]|tara:strand:- start:113452 stop:114198 length:747 start_codon:yes stop_codon:yes gene_type:complete
MSDISHGPDWWQDEKGKWHPSYDVSNLGIERIANDFSTELDSSNEVTEENITHHFMSRYKMEPEILDPEMIKDLRKGKEDIKWAPSKGNSRVRFMRPQTPSDIFSGLVGLGAGFLLAISIFFDWAKASGSLLQGSVNPIRDSNGVGVLCLGFSVAVFAVLLLLGKRKRWVGLAMLILGLSLVFLTVFSVIDITNTSDKIPSDLVQRFPNIDIAYANEAKLDIAVGLWLALGGAFTAFLAGISGLKRHI